MTVPDLETLLGTWKSLEIARAFLKWATRSWSAQRAEGKLIECESPGGVKEAFFGERLYIGNRVRVTGRLSHYCPIYFPVAYSPQAQFNPAPGSWFAGHNPAPTAMAPRTSSGEAIAFLFDAAARETPRIVSPFHPDRTQMIPFHLADPGLPVVVDAPSEPLMEQLVAVDAIVSPLDPAIASIIASSHEEVVKLYYHTFFQADFYPKQGYVLDARTRSGGRLRALAAVAPFETTIAFEARYSSSLFHEDVEAAIQKALNEMLGGDGAARYQPAYYTPPGYRIVQFSQSGLLVHLAPEIGVLNIGTVIDTLNPDREMISQRFLPTAKAIVDAIRDRDSAAVFSGLFASHERFFKQVGVRAAS